MKKMFIQYLLLFALFSPLVASAQTLETFTLDPMHTYVLWHINHFGFSNPSGKWMTSGTLMLDKTKPQLSKVNVTIQIATIDTGIQELNEHLQGPLFFDVAKFPTATFVSNKVVVTGKDTANVEGSLTIHGVSKPVTLAVKFNKAGINPVTNNYTVGFSATTTLNRSDFDITTLLPDISDKVNIEIEAEAYQASQGKLDAH